MTSNLAEETSINGEKLQSQGEKQLIDFTKYEWVPATHAAIREKCSVKTIYSRADSKYYTSRKTQGKQLEVLLLKEVAAFENVNERFSPSIEGYSPRFENKDNSTNPLLVAVQELVTQVKTSTETVQKTNETLLEELKERRHELTRLHDEVGRLNNERANINGKLQLYRDVEKEKRELEEQLERAKEATRKEEEARLKAEQQAKAAFEELESLKQQLGKKRKLLGLFPIEFFKV